MRRNYGPNIDTAVAYIHGRIEVEIETFARGLGIPPGELAERLAALLSPAPVRQELGDAMHMPLLRGQTPEVGEAMEPLEMGSTARSHRTQKPKNSSKKRGAKKEVNPPTPSQRIVDVLNDAGAPLKAREIADELEVSTAAVMWHLRNLRKLNRVRMIGRGSRTTYQSI